MLSLVRGTSGWARDSDSAGVALETTPLRSEEGERDDGLDQSEAYAASFDPDGGSDDPMQWPEAYKWAMVVLLALMSFTVTFTCISVVPVASRIVKDLDGDSDETPSQSAGVLLVTIWELGEAAGPLLIAPLSEALGRAPLLHGTNALFILATLLAALSRSTGALVAARALTGAAVSSNVLYPPIVGDVFPPEQRGRALSVFMFATLLGGTLGPAFGGAAAEGLPMLGGWRAVLWASLALATLCEGLALVFFRETYAVAILRRRAAARRLGGRDKALLPGPSSVGETRIGMKEESSAAGFRVSSITRPFVVLFGSGVLASLAVFGSVIFSYFYVVSVTLPTILDEIYGLSPAAIGSSFLANGIGSLIGIAICNLSLDRIYVKLKTKNDGVGLPEYRLPLAIVGAFILPPGIALYGWCAEYRLPLWLLYVSVVWIRMALMLAFLPLMAYVVDAYGIYSASAMTGVIVVRCLAGAFLPVVTVLVIQDLGYGWGFATLSALCLVLGFIPVVIMRNPNSLFLPSALAARPSVSPHHHYSPPPPPPQILPRHAANHFPSSSSSLRAIHVGKHGFGDAQELHAAAGRGAQQGLCLAMVVALSRGTSTMMTSSPPSLTSTPPQLSATVEDLDPPAALSLNPSDAISLALLSAFERDYTHLTVVDSQTRALLGYISIPHLQALLDAGRVKPDDPLRAAMTRFQRRGRAYRVITMDTPLEDLEDFFRGGVSGGEWKQEFAVITDENRRFVLGVATVQDLDEFVKRRPA
ncbi:hypothetical protein Purlil1_9049 [Purpureocillium lilacinum]|uniref:Major facilitator superfamily (MFS) profile domain-containing protein n=1 Tax=Purpureocillium lilacinum TaxID=33203 RepID=A0ABR0BRT4_PURLI|nr:hypothetical protein Purlil1_9049 [Purpureocillium lilacinum]